MREIKGNGKKESRGAAPGPGKLACEKSERERKKSGGEEGVANE
jgi:hypothetical protein